MNALVTPEDCTGYTKPPAGAVLRELAQLVPQTQAIVEIGVFQCRSLLYLAEGSAAGHRAPVFGVDPWNLPGERYPFAWTQEKAGRSRFTLDETYTAALFNVEHSAHPDLISLIRAHSVDAAAEWGSVPYKIGLLHVDGNHDAEHVQSDFDAWQPHLAPGAIICWDDFVPACQPVIDVTRRLAAQGFITSPMLAKGCRRLAVTRYLG